MYDVIIVGGGTSGLMATLQAIKRYKKVLLIEKNDKLGSKLLLSGNSRCNVTNLKSNFDFIKNVKNSNNKFILSCLSDFGPWDIYDFFEQNNCMLKEEDDNRVFPISNKSSDILNVLVNQITCEIKYNEYLVDLNKEDNFILKTNKGIYHTKKVILATGGKSYPNLGTTGDLYPILEQLNLKITDIYPALCALNSNDLFIKNKSLMGITLNDVLVKFNNEEVIGNVLFTHFGVSGPGVFKISENVVRYLSNNKQAVISLDFLPDYDEEYFMSLDKNLTLSNVFKELIQNRVVKFLLKDLEHTKINSISKQAFLNVINKFKDFKVTIYSSKGFSTAFVTSGGLDLTEVNPKTLEVKKIPGLYVSGELLDLHAYTGGYNITIALSTGYKVGNSV